MRKIYKYEQILYSGFHQQSCSRRAILFFAGSLYYSTATQADSIMDGMELKWSRVAVFWDINKAYDSAWHTGPIYKLFQMKISGELIRIIVFSSSEVVQNLHGQSCVRVETDVSRSSAGFYVISDVIYHIFIGHTEVCSNRNFCYKSIAEIGLHDFHTWMCSVASMRSKGWPANDS